MRKFGVQKLIAETPGGVFHTLDFGALEAEVTRLETVEGGTETLLKRLFDEFESHVNEPAVLNGLIARGRAAVDKLAAANAANTPADPNPAPVPVTPPDVPPV